MRLINADELYRAKFHGAAEIVPPEEHNPESYKRGWNDAIDAIIDESCTPTIEPERKFGEWIDNETSNADGVRQTCTCSVCGIRSYRPLGDFCRWCGADMLHENSDAGNLIPNIEPERKKGRWININDSEKYRCSECGITMWFMKSLDITPDTYIFCPHCGAEMTEGKKKSGRTNHERTNKGNLC